MNMVGDEVSKPYVFTLDSIRRFAGEAGDENVLHHDEAAAATSRFGGVIASGPQMAAVLMGLIASATTAHGEGVGLDFNFRFKKAIPAGTATIMSWQITGSEPHPGLKGDLLALEGRISDATTGAVFVTCAGHCVIWPDAAGLRPVPLE
jgi:3-hydroxybutyryl-CoA dehydratase